jgi:ABC-type oligopeptide transport system ATPase subunit
MNDIFDIEHTQADLIFENDIFPCISKKALPELQKKAYIVGGQPGSGKSAFAAHLIQGNTGVVFINGDDLRGYHPNYVTYLKTDDEHAADKTQAVCNYWIEKSIGKCIAMDFSFIVEGTMRTEQAPLQTATIAKDAGYDVYGCALSTPYALSLASTVFRYTETKKKEGSARYTKRKSHDEAYDNLSQTVERLLMSKLFDEFFIYERLDGVFRENKFSLLDSKVILPILERGRIRALTGRELEFTKINVSLETPSLLPKIQNK